MNEMFINKVISAACGKVLLLMSVVMLLVSSCSKKDIQPEPVGEAVPYTPPATRKWQAIMKDPSYTYWNAAWRRSRMDTLVAGIGAAYYTIFMATDKAFTDAGWTMAKISAADTAVLDTLLAYHIVPGFYRPDNLSALRGSLPLKTLLTSGSVADHTPDNPYTYKLYVGYQPDSLVIDGIPANKWKTGEEALNGYVYPIERLLKKPEMSMLQYLESDPRFSLFLSAIRISDQVYSDNYVSIFNEQFLAGNPDYGVVSTLFAPTNRAFQNSGFNTAADIQAYVDNSLVDGYLPYADYDSNFFFVQPVTAIDSLLLPHGLEESQAASGGGYITDISFFTNDLLQNGPALSGMLIKPGQMYNNPPVLVSLRFSNNNGKPMVQRLGSARPPLPLAETNIKVLNGVIHVVDESLLLP